MLIGSDGNFGSPDVMLPDLFSENTNFVTDLFKNLDDPLRPHSLLDKTQLCSPAFQSFILVSPFQVCYIPCCLLSREDGFLPHSHLCLCWKDGQYFEGQLFLEAAFSFEV